MFIEYLFHHTHIYLLSSRLFATSAATIFSFAAAMILFPPFIALLRKHSFSSDLNTAQVKNETVMPAGALFMGIILVTTLLTSRFNSFVWSALVIYTFFGIIGGIDDVAKALNKKKLLQGMITKQDYMYKSDGISSGVRFWLYILIPAIVAIAAYKFIPTINGHIVIPFSSIHKHFPYLPFWIFIPMMTLIISVMANGVNFTDGRDTLATVPLITSLLFLGLTSYVSSNEVWAKYLLIPHIIGIEEILPLIGATIGVLLAFLWFNSPPASIYMGDCGSVALGGMIAIMYVFVKAEFYLPIVGFIFLLQFSSSFLQIGFFKLTKKRLFRMAPMHHHFEILMQENPFYDGNKAFIRSKLTWRYHIVSIILLVVGLIIFFKVR